ncbi:MAG: hypothetical protein U0401_20180 [Anaerolineae bacterium]
MKIGAVSFFSGFQKITFTEDLYRFLTRECSLIARYNWNISGLSLQCRSHPPSSLVKSPGGNGRSVDFGTLAWLGGPASISQKQRHVP